MSASRLDPRVTPARQDLAAAHLHGQVQAARFVEGTLKRIFEPVVPLRRAPQRDLGMETEALYGERVTVYESNAEGWAWGQLELDGYVGWLPAGALADPGRFATHRVAALGTFLYPRPDIKTLPMVSFPFGSRLAIAREEGKFAVTDEGAYVPLQHLVPVGHREPDYVATARRLLGVPYLWGGRSSLGLDCSALMQLALQAAGIECPRDSDMQASLGSAVDFGSDLSKLKRGDLVYWQGHIGLVAGEGCFLHANAHHMAVVEEPLADAIQRIRTGGLEILTVRRL
jgi:cell wall-associated NlpC family hydrolase